VPADYDGDGRADFAVYRPSTGVWYYVRSGSNQIYPLPYTSFKFGISTDVAVPADYDGDGRTDIAVYRPDPGIWYIWQSSTNSLRSERFGASLDVPVPTDYDGDGKAEPAVFRPSNGAWYLQQSRQGFTGFYFGTAEDQPVILR